MVAEYTARAIAHDPLDALGGIGDLAYNVAQADHLAHGKSLDIGKHGIERVDVAGDVAQDRNEGGVAHLNFHLRQAVWARTVRAEKVLRRREESFLAGEKNLDLTSMLVFDSRMNPSSTQPVGSRLVSLRRWLDSNEIFFNDCGPDALLFYFDLESVFLRFLCRELESGKIIVSAIFPVRSAVNRRPAVGEYLHRVNFGLSKPVLQFDLGDGEVRSSFEMPLTMDSAEGSDFDACLSPVLGFSQKIFPYLISVMTGAMTAEFAADQTAAALAQ